MSMAHCVAHRDLLLDDSQRKSEAAGILGGGNESSDAKSVHPSEEFLHNQYHHCHPCIPIPRIHLVEMR